MQGQDEAEEGATQVQRYLRLPHREEKRDEMGQEKTRLKCCATFTCLIKSSSGSLLGSLLSE